VKTILKLVGATRLLPRDDDVEKLHGDPTVVARCKVWTRGGNPFQGMMMRKNSTETQQSGNSTRSGPKVKDKEPKLYAWRGSDEGKSLPDAFGRMKEARINSKLGHSAKVWTKGRT